MGKYTKKCKPKRDQIEVMDEVIFGSIILAIIIFAYIQFFHICG